MTIRISEADKNALLAEARALGFAAAGVCAPDAAAQAGRKLAAFVGAGRHGTMGWLADRLAARADPRALWPDVGAVLAVAADYTPTEDPTRRFAWRENGVISVYAQGADYHDVLKKRLKRLGRWAGARFGCDLKVFVDTAPVMEKPLAEAAGLGWRGKHTNLVSRAFGSWLFLGVIYLNVTIEPDDPETDHCGSCRRCLNVCPTNAFPAPYEIDARRCLSYLTIEHKEPWAEEFRLAVGPRIYGCDDCLAVCPWNKFAQAPGEAAFHPRAELQAPQLVDLAALDDAGFRQLFAGSPIKRIGRDRFVRNVLYSMGSLGDAGFEAAVRGRLDDDAALVRGAAAWAFSRIAPAAFAAMQGGRLESETDLLVRAEWAGRPDAAAAGRI